MRDVAEYGKGFREWFPAWFVSQGMVDRLFVLGGLAAGCKILIILLTHKIFRRISFCQFQAKHNGLITANHVFAVSVKLSAAFIVLFALKPAGMLVEERNWNMVRLPAQETETIQSRQCKRRAVVSQPAMQVPQPFHHSILFQPTDAWLTMYVVGFLILWCVGGVFGRRRMRADGCVMAGLAGSILLYNTSGNQKYCCKIVKYCCIISFRFLNKGGGWNEQDDG